MPIKPLKSTLDQHNLLITRGLTIKNKDFFIDYINKNNYFNVINGNEDLLLVKPGDKVKNYDTASFDDFVRLHKFDKILTNQVTSILHDFETKLKTSISRHFTESYCRTPENTMQYTNKQNYLDLTTYLGNKYPLYHDQNRKVVDEFHDFFLFKPQFLYFLVKNNDFIDIDIFSTPSSQYTPPSGCSLYEEDNKQIVVPLWVAIETFDFGKLQRFCHYSKKAVLEKVLKDFGLNYADRDLFLNSLDIIRELRNKCAHFSLINRFSTASTFRILPTLVNKLNLSPAQKIRTISGNGRKKHTKHAAVLNLYDTLKVLGLYEDLTRLKKPLKKIIYSNNKNFRKNTYDLNARLLERMGNSNYCDWKKILS
ncbi:Abi family protein [Paenibacillus alginolyticus]|uniref:Abi family protein n=1 Tax=Paenibacillus alginolyticus TaxID=59839 RepID=A0ABT4GAA5_9BACL|nr:Abi family protein [Paenibacillus alginolyticus]MCY9693100.1 Abi family protein [Paenibacillus alginolyticus]MEC0147187.1 Abi family protein [Paenibacillus alginolyticus]